MKRVIVERQKLIDAVSSLPDEAVLELARFLDYLHYKSAQRGEPSHNAANFLLDIAGLGSSGQQDVSERAKEILRTEIN